MSEVYDIESEQLAVAQGKDSELNSSLEAKSEGDPEQIKIDFHPLR